MLFIELTLVSGTPLYINPDLIVSFHANNLPGGDTENTLVLMSGMEVPYLVSESAEDIIDLLEEYYEEDVEGEE